MIKHGIDQVALIKQFSQGIGAAVQGGDGIDAEGPAGSRIDAG